MQAGTVKTAVWTQFLPVNAAQVLGHTRTHLDRGSMHTTIMEFVVPQKPSLLWFWEPKFHDCSIWGLLVK